MKELEQRVREMKDELEEERRKQDAGLENSKLIFDKIKGIIRVKERQIENNRALENLRMKEGEMLHDIVTKSLDKQEERRTQREREEHEKQRAKTHRSVENYKREKEKQERQERERQVPDEVDLEERIKNRLKRVKQIEHNVKKKSKTGVRKTDAEEKNKTKEEMKAKKGKVGKVGKEKGKGKGKGKKKGSSLKTLTKNGEGKSSRESENDCDCEECNKMRKLINANKGDLLQILSDFKKHLRSNHS